jgi:hypothetical protein
VKFEWPELWDELTDDQYFKIIEELEKKQNADVSQIKLFFIISGCSKWFIMLRMKPDEMKVQLIDQLVIPFLENRKFSSGILKNSFSGFVGASDYFSNFTWAQYCLVDHYFTQYLKGKTELLDSICALIYFPTQSNFDNKKADDFLRFWSEQKEFKKRAILLHFAELKKTVAKMYPNLFPNKKQELLTPNDLLKSSESNHEIDYQAATISLAGGPFGNREQLDNEPVHNVLKFLDMKAQSKNKTQK